jgi:hypothetical protein
VCSTGIALFRRVPKGPNRGPQGGSPDDRSEGLQISRIRVPDGLGGTEVHMTMMDTPSHCMSSSTTRRVSQGCPSGMPIAAAKLQYYRVTWDSTERVDDCCGPVQGPRQCTTSDVTYIQDLMEIMDTRNLHIIDMEIPRYRMPCGSMVADTGYHESSR